MHRYYFLIFLTLCCFIFSTAHAQWELDLEAGPAFSGYNDIQVPGDDGTRFSLNEQLETGANFFYRIKLLYTLREKHTFALLFAPLTIRAEGFPDQNIAFFGETFLPEDPLTVAYQFNSYRLTYRYLFPRSSRFQFGIGATAKIRDARIALQGPNGETEKTNVGFVPLINFRVEWFAKERLSILLQGDALASPQGRAEDILLAALLYPTRNTTLKLGYRILEGGANNEEVYNFTLIHYAVIGGIIRF